MLNDNYDLMLTISNSYTSINYNKQGLFSCYEAK